MLISFSSLFMAGLILSACGFSPLYSEHTIKGNSNTAIHLKKGNDILNQEVKEQMLRIMGKAEKTDYILSLDTRENLIPLAVRQDGRATRQAYHIEARYDIRDKAGKIISEGISRTQSSYNIVVSPFANLTAKEDAKARAVKSLAEDIWLRLGLFLRQRHGS